MNHKLHTITSTKTRLIWYIITSGFLLFLDQTLKSLARANPKGSWYLIEPWLGWEYLPNPGIAFEIPVPNALLIIITPIILLGGITFILHKKKNTPLLLLGTCLVIAGAVSNLIDRFLFSITIDYLRIITSVINIADILIVVGAILILINEKRN
ncbi:MAG: signal peptidase II [Candidatus Magasanikbacteria bacterium]|jgi:signal peptidase II|nr:signal peptidase II [Candidatus Magasanikbacteria bacterium]MBT4220976.1 signal peptidase II [Candidatus Magasanikbacteria bacterium]MBT4350494.1 signal peptidase II [Candidatus Magasanikbacteria bacterium]MBT4541953.1 signal peptidase II [Candidatus Magasanikbacteria bacterium]MBT6252881.1 signal peptidase II [Candidatus Magasanikbacteria bacterium]